MAIHIERTDHTAAELRRLACRAGSPAQARRMLAIALVLEGADRTTADVEVDGVVRWRCVDLKGVIADRFTVELSERSVGRLLNGRGYTRLKPRPQNRKADPAAQAAFKKTSPRR